LRVKNWVLSLVGNDVTLYPQDDELDVVTVFSEEGITEISLAFDQNMQPVVGYIASGVAKLRWFSAGISQYVTTELSASSRSIFLTMDDKRKAATEGNLNDVLVFYLRDDALLFRQQRDLYAIERNLYTFVGTESTFVRRVGFLSGYRVGIELYDLPNLPECDDGFVVPVSGSSPLTGLSMTATTGAPAITDREVALSNTSMAVFAGNIIASSVNQDRTLALTGRSVTVSRGSVAVAQYPDLASSAVSQITSATCKLPYLLLISNKCLTTSSIVCSSSMIRIYDH
jgi:hypothetical protein